MSFSEARLVPFSLPLVRPIETARGALHERRGWLVRLFDANGVEGHGMAMPIDGFGGEAFDACGAALSGALEQAAREGGGRLLPGPPMSGHARAPFAASAWALAHADLAARQAARPLADFISDAGAAPRTAVPVNALVWAKEPATLRAQVHEARAFPVLKLKVGAEVDAALAQVEVACGALAEGQRLRVDPNASWSEADAGRALAALEGHPIEYVEQPVTSAAALARLHATSPVAVAADESASDTEGLLAIVRGRAASIVVMKPMRVGGPQLAARLGALAQAAGLGLVVTSILDASIGVRAALAVALALPDAPLACGLATDSIFETDLTARLRAPRPGELGAWSEPGLGTEIDDTVLAACALSRGQAWGA